MRRLSLTIGSANLAQVKSFKRRTDEHTTLIICQLIETMEQLYPDIYNNIATNLHISTFTERILCQDFGRFTEVLFKNGMKWSLVLAYFAFCGGLAEECVRHGNARLINSILNWNESFVSLHLGKWVAAEGGWVRKSLNLCILIDLIVNIAIESHFAPFLLNLHSLGVDTRQLNSTLYQLVIPSNGYNNYSLRSKALVLRKSLGVKKKCWKFEAMNCV